MKRKADILITIALIGSFLIFSAWIVSQRTGNVDLNFDDNVPSQFTDSDLNLPSTTFTPPLTAGGETKLPVLSNGMPEFSGIHDWLNSDPLTQESLRGKVVLIDFWTYSCINCIRTLPHLTTWYDKYERDGFVLIGVHTPEFAFEKITSNVENAIEEHGINYPVAQDNDFDTWTNYSNRYWPAHYLFDADGKLRFTHFGEGKYEETERNIVALLKEAGRAPGGTITKDTPRLTGQQRTTPELYLGYKRLEHLGSPEELLRDEVQTYTSLTPPQVSEFYFERRWIVEGERAVAKEDGANIILRYTGSEANLVIGPPPGSTGRVRISVDGEVTKTITIEAETLYVMYDTPGEYKEHTLKLEFLDAGTSAYAFTFG